MGKQTKKIEKEVTLLANEVKVIYEIGSADYGESKKAECMIYT